MKRLTVCVVCSCAVFGGCGEGQMKDSGGKVRLPADIAGTWKAESTDAPIEVTVSERGQVVSAVMTPGNVRVTPNSTTKVEMQDGTFSTYKTGDFLAEYNAEIRELTVELRLEHMELNIGSEKIEGNKRDVFAGTVDEEGRVWEATWMEIFDFGPQFPMAPEAIGVALRFVKVEN